MTKKILNWMVVIFWMVLIYWFSHQPDLHSDLQPLWDLIFRKIAHMAEFFVLAYLISRALREHGLKINKTLILGAILAIIYAGLDEWHQTFVFMRQGKISDVLVDSLGILVFLILNFKYTKE